MVDYYVRDLSADSKVKVKIQNKEELIEVVSRDFKKPMFNLYLKNEDLEEFKNSKELNTLKVKEFSEQEFKVGDFLLTIESQEGL